MTSRLVEYAAPAARAACRTIANDPVLTAYIDSRIQEWVLDWTPQDDHGTTLRAYIARRASNEARRYLALGADERRKLRWAYKGVTVDIPEESATLQNV